MKTLKIMVVMFLIVSFAPVTVSSQEPVRDVFDAYFELPYACMNQDLVGTLTVERTFMNSHYQSRISGTLKGSTDGLDYYIEMINNIQDKGNWPEWGQETITFTWPGNYHISRDGKLIAIIHFAYHMTVNPNGVITAEFGDAYECNLVSQGRFK